MGIEITSLILHYNRPKNIRKVIDGIRSQTIKSKIIVVDNSGNLPSGLGEDVHIRTEKNTFCLPRYEMINAIDTKYIFNTDDDLAIDKRDLFEEFVLFMDRHPDCVIGWNGRVFDFPEMNWEKAYSFPNGGFVDYDVNESILCDTINFGVSFFKTETLKGKFDHPYDTKSPYAVSELEFKHGDDIWISSQIKEKRVMPFHLKNHFEWLDEGKYALSKQSPHMTMRDALVKRFFMSKYK